MRRPRVSLRLDARRGELAVLDDGMEATLFRLRRGRPERLGWWRRRADGGWVRASVGEVVCHCLRDWDTEETVLLLSRRAAERAIARGGDWCRAGRRLRDQCADARRSRRLLARPFQKLWRQLTEEAPEAERLSKSVAAQRAGYGMRDGRVDTVRLERRLGLAAQRRESEHRRSRFVNYETALALCRALGRDPVELGL
jgi:hypothetical protein